MRELVGEEVQRVDAHVTLGGARCIGGVDAVQDVEEIVLQDGGGERLCTSHAGRRRRAAAS